MAPHVHRVRTMLTIKGQSAPYKPIQEHTAFVAVNSCRFLEGCCEFAAHAPRAEHPHRLRWLTWKKGMVVRTPYFTTSTSVPTSSQYGAHSYHLRCRSGSLCSQIHAISKLRTTNQITEWSFPQWKRLPLYQCAKLLRQTILEVSPDTV